MATPAVSTKIRIVDASGKENVRATEGFSQYRDLLLMLTSRDIKIRYKQSVMGFAWAVLMPILIVGSGLIVTVAFSTLSKQPINRSDVLSVAVKAVPWAFFVGAIRFATNSLIMNRELVTKIYFPREILPLASVLASLFDFAVATTVLVIVLLAVQVGASIYLLWVLPLLLLMIMFAAGAGILLSCGNLFFRDVKYLVDVVLTYGVFFTPVLYSPSSLGKWGFLMMINPIGPVLEGFRAVVVLHRPPDLPWLAYSAVFASAGLVCSWLIFQRSESLFAETV